MEQHPPRLGLSQGSSRPQLRSLGAPRSVCSRLTYRTNPFALRPSCRGAALTTEAAKGKPSKQTNETPNPTKPKPNPHRRAAASDLGRRPPSESTARRAAPELCRPLTTCPPALPLPLKFKRAAPSSSHTFTAPPAPCCLNQQRLPELPSSRLPEVSRRKTVPAPQLLFFHVRSFSSRLPRCQSHRWDCGPTLRAQENGARKLRAPLLGPRHRRWREQRAGPWRMDVGLQPPSPWLSTGTSQEPAGVRHLQKETSNII